MQKTRSRSVSSRKNINFRRALFWVFRGAGNFDGRVRYWHYDRDSEVLGWNGSVGIKFDVLDVEAVHRFAARKSELTLSGGLRLAGIRLHDINLWESNTDLIGLTLAGDGLTPLGAFPGGYFGLVYGGRLSILRGDWNGDGDSQFVNRFVGNDNVVVNELYAGVELARRINALDVHLRLLFEMQNWRSDVLAQNAGIESIGILGPACRLALTSKIDGESVCSPKRKQGFTPRPSLALRTPIYSTPKSTCDDCAAVMIAAARFWRF